MRKWRLSLIMFLAFSFAFNGSISPIISANAITVSGQTIMNSEANISQAEIQKFSTDVLKALQKKDLKKLSAYVNPKKNLVIALSPNLVKGQYATFTKTKLAKLNKKTKVMWGLEGGTGEPVKVGFDSVQKEYLWSVNYFGKDVKVNFGENIVFKSDKPNYNDIFSGGTAIEYFYPGTEANSNLDWKSLVLIFEKANGKLYLSAIIHEEWTP